MLQKIRFFDKKYPKLSLSELLSWMTIFKSIHMAFYVNPSLEHVHCLETINNMWFLGKRESVNAWKKVDFDGFREKDE
jgi:hypothetical protein